MMNEERIPRDMYGHPIFPLGETGFGISVTFNGDGRPYFTLFHEGGQSKQSLCSLMYDPDIGLMQTCNQFEGRIAELFGEAD